jgi:hypothetical protein
MAGNGKRYSREFRERAVGLVFEQVSEHASEWEAICAVASKLGISARRCVSGCGRPRSTRARGRGLRARSRPS